MTPEERKTYIETLLKKVGLSTDLSSKITGEDQAAIATEVLDMVVADTDRRINTAVKTNSDKLQSEFKAKLDEAMKRGGSGSTDSGSGSGDTGGQQNSGQQGGGQSGQAEDIKAVIAEYLKPVTEKLTAIETERQQERQAQTINQVLKKAGLPESFGRYVQVGEDGDIEAAVKQVKSDFTAAKQAEIDQGLAGTTPPGKGNGDGATDLTNAIKAVAEAQKAKPKGLAAQQVEKMAEA